MKDIQEKVNNLIQKYDLAGVGSWQKGMETDEVWSMLEEKLK